MENINWDAITVNTKAAARAVAQLALSVEGLPKRKPPTERKPTSRSLQEVMSHACSDHDHAHQGVE